MATAFEGRFTPQEYLARERNSPGSKSEYVNGHIYAMGGASLAHNRIVYNLAGELRNQIRGGPCSAVSNDMRVKVPQTEMYTYPDVIVFCGEPRLEDDHFDTLLNPTIIIEVLSPSTERYDRGDKWAHFRLIESLQMYVLLAQDQIRAETFMRRGDEWVYAEASGEEGVLNLEAAGCSIPLGSIYELVEISGGARKSGGTAEEQTV
jgi:Uma2 family endonuclease